MKLEVDGGEKFFWRGILLESMTKEELIAALKESIKIRLADYKEHARQLEEDIQIVFTVPR
jgi:hypothetical protein